MGKTCDRHGSRGRAREGAGAMRMYSKKEVKDALQKELRQYEAAIGCLAPDERKELREWVAAGNSANGNPYCYADESGYPLGFVEAARLAADMLACPEGYSL